MADVEDMEIVDVEAEEMEEESPMKVEQPPQATGAANGASDAAAPAAGAATTSDPADDEDTDAKPAKETPPPALLKEEELVRRIVTDQVALAAEQAAALRSLIRDMGKVPWPKAVTEQDPPEAETLYRRRPRTRQQQGAAALDGLEVQLMQLLDARGRIGRARDADRLLELTLQATRDEHRVLLMEALATRTGPECLTRLVGNGVLRVLKQWLFLYDDAGSPSWPILRRLLEVLRDLPVTPESLEATKIGKVVSKISKAAKQSATEAKAGLGASKGRAPAAPSEDDCKKMHKLTKSVRETWADRLGIKRNGGGGAGGSGRQQGEPAAPPPLSTGGSADDADAGGGVWEAVSPSPPTAAAEAGVSGSGAAGGEKEKKKRDRPPEGASASAAAAAPSTLKKPKWSSGAGAGSGKRKAVEWKGGGGVGAAAGGAAGAGAAGAAGKGPTKRVMWADQPGKGAAAQPLTEVHSYERMLVDAAAGQRAFDKDLSSEQEKLRKTKARRGGAQEEGGGGGAAAAAAAAPRAVAVTMRKGGKMPRPRALVEEEVGRRTTEEAARRQRHEQGRMEARYFQRADIPETPREDGVSTGRPHQGQQHHASQAAIDFQGTVDASQDPRPRAAVETLADVMRSLPAAVAAQLRADDGALIRERCTGADGQVNAGKVRELARLVEAAQNLEPMVRKLVVFTHPARFLRCLVPPESASSKQSGKEKGASSSPAKFEPGLFSQAISEMMEEMKTPPPPPPPAPAPAPRALFPTLAAFPPPLAQAPPLAPHAHAAAPPPRPPNPASMAAGFVHPHGPLQHSLHNHNHNHLAPSPTPFAMNLPPRSSPRPPSYPSPTYSAARSSPGPRYLPPPTLSISIPPRGPSPLPSPSVPSPLLQSPSLPPRPPPPPPSAAASGLVLPPPVSMSPSPPQQQPQASPRFTRWTLCRHFKKTGRCRFGANCIFRHDFDDNGPAASPPT